MKLIFSFHVPLFFIISGYLYKDRNDKISNIKYIRRIAVRYIRPYFFLCGCNLILNYFVKMLGISKQPYNFTKYIIGILYSRGTSEYMPDCSPLWFLTCIFCALSIFHFVHRLIKNKAVRVLVIFAICSISIILEHLDFVKLVWNLDTACMAVLFIEIGYVIKKYNLILRIYHSGFFVLVALACILYGVSLSSINTVEHVDFNENIYGIFGVMLLCAVVILISLMLISVAITQSRLKDCFAPLSYLGKHTLFIMGFDFFSGTIANAVICKFFYFHWFIWFVGKMIVLVIGVVLWNAIVRQLPLRISKHLAL